MKTNKLLPLVLFAYVSAALADKTWSGAVSSDWSDPANWAEGAVPGDDETVTLTANTPFAPTNLDIQGLHLDAIKFDAEQTQGFTISGEPFYLGKIQATGAYSHVVTNTILNDITLTRTLDANMGGNNNHVVHLAGSIGDEGKGYGIWSGASGSLILSGHNTYTGTTDFNLGVLRFFSDENLGTPPTQPTSMGLSCRFANVILEKPADKHFYSLEINRNRSLYHQLQIPAGTELVYNGDLQEQGNSFLFFGTNGDRMSTVRYGGDPASLVHTLQFAQNGKMLLVFENDIVRNVFLYAYQAGAADFNGHDTAMDIGVYVCGPDYYPSFINSDCEHESTVSGDVIIHYENNNRFFGGPGAIRVTGSILEETGDGVQGPRPFYKNDGGKLTLAGETSDYGGATAFAGGTVVLDHTVHNTAKISPRSGTFTLNGSRVVLIGNDSEDSFESVPNIDNQRNVYRLDASAIEVVSGANADATFTFGGFHNNGAAGFSSQRTFDLSVRNPGSGTARIVATNLQNDASFGGINPCVTWDHGRTWAKVLDGGVIGGMPDSDYATALDGNVLFDAPAGTTTRTSGMDIKGIRFKNPAGSTLSIENNSKVRFTLFGGNCGVLMTPESGDVLLTGGRFDNGGYWEPITFFQYSTNHTLRVETQIIDTVGLKVFAVGPGTVTLANDRNAYGSHSYAMAGATLEFTSAAMCDSSSRSALGSGQYNNGLYIGQDSTMRYIGTVAEGHETDRVVVLSGDGTLEAAGAGPLVFNNEGNFVTTQWNGSHRFSLAGSGDGSIAGSLRPGYFGSLRKTGTGTWTLSGADSLFYYPTTIEEGTLRLAGNLPSDTIVKDGGTLDILPGAELQRHLNVEGKLRYTYNAANPEPIEVWGRATLGGTLEVKGIINEPVVILTAENGIEGEFESVPARLDIRYTANSVIAKPRGGTLIFVR